MLPRAFRRISGTTTATYISSMNESLVRSSFAPASAPTHDEIAQCARELWTESGRPGGRDEAIWLEAERRLVAARRAPVAKQTPINGPANANAATTLNRPRR